MLRYAILSLALLSVSATGQVPTQTYPINTVLGYLDGGRNNPDVMMYIAGAGGALAGANANLQMRKQPLLYCQPNSLTLNGENYRQILDKSLAELPPQWRNIPHPETFMLEYALLRGLQRTFPC